MTLLGLKKKLVLQAIQVLRDLNSQYYGDSSKKKPLFEGEEDSTLHVQVMLKKIPKSKLIKMIKVELPHSLIKDTSEVCLITGDLDKKDRKAEIEPDILHYKLLLDKLGVSCISEVITLRQLRTEYKPYEAKQKLLAAFDVFLSDNRIHECLPKVLGRHFFKKRKFPIQINLKTSNLKQQVEKALATKVFYITGHGNSCSSEVASLDMTDSEILENVKAMAKALFENVPGSWHNVMGIYLKTSRSKAIPLYVSYDSSNDVELPEEKTGKSFVIDEISTNPNFRVKVHSDGRVETIGIKEVLETVDSDTEESNFGSKLQLLGNESESNENSESETTKQVNSEKGAKPIKKKRKSLKQKSVSPNQYQEKTTKQLKSEDTIKPVKKKKKNIKQKPVSPRQFRVDITKDVKSVGKIKSEKQRKNSIEEKLVSLDESLKKTESLVKTLKKVVSKRKRDNSAPLTLDLEQSVNNNETPVQPIKKRKLEGINMKRYQSMKESQKSNRKKNQRKTRQKS